MSVMDAKRNYVIETATNLVLSRPLSRVTVRDVAQEAGVGEATVYRYFSTKTSLIVACALKLQGEVSQYFLRESKPVDGYTKLVKFYASYVDLFAFRPELYRFLYEFDVFCVEQRVKGLDEYSDNLDVFRDAYLAAYREGVEVLLHDNPRRPVACEETRGRGRDRPAGSTDRPDRRDPDAERDVPVFAQGEQLSLVFRPCAGVPQSSERREKTGSNRIFSVAS